MESKQDFLVRIGRNIRKYRKAINLSQGALAKLIASSDNHISCIETGQKSANVFTLKKIADALGIDTKDLL